MFDVDCKDDSFADLLVSKGVETYTFDNLPGGHAVNLKTAIDLVNFYNIDYVMGYSYGCITAYEVARATNVKGILLLDPLSKVKVNKQVNGDTLTVTKSDVGQALVDNSVILSDAMRDAYISSLSTTDQLTVFAYPSTMYAKTDYFNPRLFEELNACMFLTRQSVEASRTWCPERTVYYPSSSHWIMLEPTRVDLATDVVNTLDQWEDRKPLITPRIASGL
jgi:thioesterase domain-containing protein